MTTPEVSLHPSHEAGAHPSSPAPDTCGFPDISQESPVTSAYWDTLQRYQQTGAYEQEPLSPEEEAKRIQRQKMFWRAVKRAEKIVFVAVPALALPIIMSACTTPGMVGIVGMPGDNARADSATGEAPEQPVQTVTLQSMLDVPATPDLANQTVVATTQTPESNATIVDPFIDLDTATFEFPSTATEQPPAATEQPVITASPEPSPTPKKLWCNTLPYFVHLHQTLPALIEKNPDAIPAIDNMPVSIVHWGDDPETEKIEQSQCTGLVSPGSEIVALNKSMGFSDKENSTCLEKGYEIFIGKNFTNSRYWELEENQQWDFTYDDKSHTCYWEPSFLSPKDREELRKVYPYFR